MKVDLSDLTDRLEDLQYDIEQYLWEDGSEFSIEGYMGLSLDPIEKDNKIVIIHYLQTDYGDKVEIDGNWRWKFSGEFDEDSILSGIMEQFGESYSSILGSFGLSMDDVTFTAEPFPEEGH